MKAKAEAKINTKTADDEDDDAQQGGVGGVSGLMNRPKAVRHLVEAPSSDEQRL